MRQLIKNDHQQPLVFNHRRINIFMYALLENRAEIFFAKQFGNMSRRGKRARQQSSQRGRIALRLEPCVAITCPLLSSSMTDEALVSAISLCRIFAIWASSRSEIIRFVNCSMYASIYSLGYNSIDYSILCDIESFKNFIAAGLDHMTHTANTGGVIKQRHHQGIVAERVNTYQSMLVFVQHSDNTST